MSILKTVESFVRDNFPPRIVLLLIVLKKRFSGDPELKILPDLLTKNRNSVDIGGYRGLFSHHLSKLSPKVYTFEANPFLAGWLNKAVKSNVQVKNVALSNANEKMIFGIPMKGNKTQDSRASLEVEKLSENMGKVKKIEVDVEKLDDQNLDNIGFVKIDVEGHELQVLKGSEDLIQKEMPILFIEIEQRHNNNPIEETFAYIEDMGYLTFFYENNVLNGLEKFDKSKHQKVSADGDILSDNYINNFFFIPKNQVEEFGTLIAN